MIRTCRWCEAEITDEDTADLWVSTEIGGTYDYCPGSPKPDFEGRQHEPRA